MIFKQSFYNIESMTAKELDELWKLLKMLLDSGKITSYLPNNTILELNNIKSSISELTNDINVIDGGTY